MHCKGWPRAADAHRISCSDPNVIISYAQVSCAAGADRCTFDFVIPGAGTAPQSSTSAAGRRLQGMQKVQLTPAPACYLQRMRLTWSRYPTKPIQHAAAARTWRCHSAPCEGGEYPSLCWHSAAADLGTPLLAHNPWHHRTARTDVYAHAQTCSAAGGCRCPSSLAQAAAMPASRHHPSVQPSTP